MIFRKALLTLTFIGFSVITVAKEAKVITVVADEWCPYNCTPNTDKEGFGVEFLRHIYEPLGVKVEYKVKSWNAAVSDTRKGKYDAIISAYKTDAEDFLFPENPYAYSISCFFVTPENKWVYSGISSLKKQKIGVIKGYSYGANIDKYVAENKASGIYAVSGSEPLKKLFGALKNNKITAAIEDESVFNYFNKTKYPDLQTKEVGCQYPGSLYIAFSPANPESKELTQMFDRGFINLKRSGKYRKILKKYGLYD